MNGSRDGASSGDARKDREAVHAWLDEYAANPATWSSYRREAERLLLWAERARGKSLASLTDGDLADYRAFLADPQPREQWVTTGGARPGRDQIGWRPFAGPLSPHSVRQSLAVIKRLFAWLVETGYLGRNPLRQPDDKPRSASLRAVDDVLPIVTTTLDALPRTSSREREHAERTRWLFALLFHGGLRIAEVARHAMSAFHVRPLGDAGEWWIALDSTRGAVRLRPASRELMQALMRYRRVQGLRPLPDEYEATPLILPIGGRDQLLKPRVLHGIVKTLFLAASRLATTNGGDAAWLKNGCPNWLRHLSGAARHPAAACDEIDALLRAETGGRRPAAASPRSPRLNEQAAVSLSTGS